MRLTASKSLEQLRHANTQSVRYILQHEQPRLPLTVLQLREMAATNATVRGKLCNVHVLTFTQFSNTLAKSGEKDIVGHALHHRYNIISLRQTSLTVGEIDES